MVHLLLLGGAAFPSSFWVPLSSLFSSPLVTTPDPATHPTNTQHPTHHPTQHPTHHPTRPPNHPTPNTPTHHPTQPHDPTTPTVFRNKKTKKKKQSKTTENFKTIEIFQRTSKNMFRSFFLDGWSDRAVRWENARFLTLLTASGRPDQSHRLAPVSITPFLCPTKKPREGWEGQREIPHTPERER